MSMAPSESPADDPATGAPAAAHGGASRRAATPDAAPSAPPGASFDDLARRVAKVGPRRGSVVQPPPAWEPDEVTLGFAMVADESGTLHELLEPVVLATIFIAAEGERRRFLNRITGGGLEEIEAITNVYWPLLVLPGPTAPEVAIFDGTGVWQRTFRYTLLPPVQPVQEILDRRLPPAECLAHLRTLQPYLAHDPGAEVLTVTGFLPVDPPLLFDVLSHSELRSDPQSPHAGFLPARHEAAWYEDVVRKMRSWLDRFASDLETLHGLKERIQTILTESVGRIDRDYAEAQAAAQARSQEALRHSDAAVAEVRRRFAEALRPHLEALRSAYALVAHSETSAATADALALRATHRRSDAQHHVARSKQADAHLRGAHRQIAESRRALEAIHHQERAEIERIAASVVDVEREGAQRLAERELFRDEFISVATDLLHALDGQIAARTSQRNLLAGYFIPLPSLEKVRVIWFPLWTAILRGPRGVRQLLFPPMRVRSGAGLGDAVRRLFGGVVLPLEPRTEQFDTVLRSTMEEAIVNDPWLASAALGLARAADLLVDPDAGRRLQVGLDELARAGWISPRQVQEYLVAFRERAARRATLLPTAGPEPPNSPAPVPPGSGGPATPP